MSNENRTQKIEYKKLNSLTRSIEVLGKSHSDIKSIVILYPDQSSYKQLKSLPQDVTAYSSFQNLNQVSPDIENLIRDLLKNDVCIVGSLEQFIRVQNMDALIMLVSRYFSEKKTVILSLNIGTLSDPEYQEFWHDLFCSMCAKIIDNIIVDGQEFVTISISNNYLVNVESGAMSKVFHQDVKTNIDGKKNHTKIYLSEGKITKQVCRNANLISYRELVAEFENIKLLAELDFSEYSHPRNFEIVEAGWITQFERNYIEGTSLEKLRITSKESQRLKSLLFEACIEFAENKVFPNDLRPWNCLVTDTRINLIDFPKNIKTDADCDKISNLLALAVCFTWIDAYGKKDYYELLEEMKLLLSTSTVYFEKDFEQRISKAWFSLESLREIFLHQTFSLSERFELIARGLN